MGGPDSLSSTIRLQFVRKRKRVKEEKEMIRSYNTYDRKSLLYDQNFFSFMLSVRARNKYKIEAHYSTDLNNLPWAMCILKQVKCVSL